ncbi:MAG: MbnP family protein [Flavobacteriales bacterium]
MNTKNLAILAGLALAISACKKDEEAPAPSNTTPTPTNGTIDMAFNLYVGDEALDMNALYQDGAGHAIRFTKTKFYVSNVHVTDHDGNVLGHFEDTYILVDASNASNTFTLGTLAPAAVHGAEITLGLAPEVNNSDPLTAEDPLNDPDMMWAWSASAGRMFLKLEGRVDRNNDGDVDDAEDGEFLYHCLNLSGDLLREIHVHVHDEVTAGGTALLNTKVDLGVLVSGLDFVTHPEAMDGGAQCVVAMDSLATSFSEL